MHKDWCKHYNGLVKERCRAGVSYTELGFPRLAPPCVPMLLDGRKKAVCELRVLPTPEELAEDLIRTTQMLTNLVFARQAIVDRVQAEGREAESFTDSMVCPQCNGGTLRFRYSGAYNGHIHAECTTPGCVKWVE